jgi:2-succinyl-5-enolpyruvyl-6-hydroxy-3-cyclohexene-1-carboxylate synthase
VKPRTPGEACATVVVDELVRNGLRHACLAPGARSAPLALAFAQHGDVDLHVTLDERSSSFKALGIAKASGVPAAVVCTSGTATANLFPAIVEARRWRVPMLVLTTDRPPELRDTGAHQTIDQIKMFGDAVLWFCELGVPDGQIDAAPNSYWRTIACRAFAEALGSPAGPVHVNLAFRDPLVPESEQEPLEADFSGRESGAPWRRTIRSSPMPDDDFVRDLAVELSGVERGLIVAGAGDFDADAFESLAAAFGWPLLADPLSNVRRSKGVISTYDSLLRSADWAERHRPDLVLRAGALDISKVMTSFISMAPRQIVVDRDADAVDPLRSATDVIAADPDRLFSELSGRIERDPSDWLRSWRRADEIAVSTIDSVLSGGELSEPAVARELVAALPPGANLMVGASMPFRDIDWFAPPSQVRFFGNRGANGIDGFVSTALGLALGSGAPVWALCGDLTFLHDRNGLLDPPAVDCTFVVVNNDGGGIFSFLPHAERAPEHFEKLFGTPQSVDLEALAALHGLGYRRATTTAELREAVAGAPGLRLVEVRTDRNRNVELHRALNTQITSALQNGP